MKKPIALGGHGNGTVVASTVEDISKVRPEWEILGFLTDRETAPINGFPVLGQVKRECVAPYLEVP